MRNKSKSGIIFVSNPSGANSGIKENNVVVQPVEAEEDKYIEGTIKFFNKEKGYGFIKRQAKDTDVFFHISKVNIDEKEFFYSWYDKERTYAKVLFKVLEGAKGPEANDIYLCGGYSWENKWGYSEQDRFWYDRKGQIRYYSGKDCKLREVLTFYNGTVYAEKNDRILEKDSVSTTDIEMLFERGEIDTLWSFSNGENKLEFREGRFNFVSSYNREKLLKWANIPLDSEEALDFAKQKGGYILKRAITFYLRTKDWDDDDWDLEDLKSKKTEAIIEIHSLVYYNITLTIPCGDGYILEPRDISRACDTKVFRAYHRVPLENGISTLLDILFKN
ncbi:MAG: cold shock domain-containing protein [Lachnospiraceae bacterium]|nr:cold shock domain-containing protein [Lachnospiraceae bacterium]